MSLIFGLCDAIALAINTESAAGGYAFPVNATVIAKGDFPLESANEVSVFIIPNAQDSQLEDLQSGTIELLFVNVVVQKQLVNADIEEVRGMATLVEQVLATMKTDVDSRLYDWIGSDGNPVYDHDLLGKTLFQAERLTNWRATT